MSTSKRTCRPLASAAGAIAAGIAGAQSLHAAVIHQAVDIDIPEDTADYQVDLNGDAIPEFDIQLFESIVKVADFDAGSSTGVLRDENGLTANLPAGAVIGPFGLFDTQGPDRLSGINDDKPDGNFQQSDGPGYIGVEFLIDDQIHYGYVGYQGTGPDGAASGKIFSLGYEDVPNTAILAGAGAGSGLTADVDADGDVDGNDFLEIQRGFGATYDSEDIAAFKDQFGQTTGAEAAVSAVPEPSALALLAAGAAGISAYRRRRRQE